MSEAVNESGIPFVSAAEHPAEITASSIILGVCLAVVLTAANAYLGLYAGVTISASIPAAVISMTILRALLKRGTILENNIVQTIATSGESLTAGIIFTIPAMLITGMWGDILFWPTLLICVTGGLLGIVFMIPLRATHIVKDATLTYPEGRACAEVLKAGESGGMGAMGLSISLVLGASFKFISAWLGFFRGTVERTWRAGNSAFFFGTDISPALLGVGYIVGFPVSLLVFLGGAITWVVALPILSASVPVQGDLSAWFWESWQGQARYLGVGAMVMGGIWTLYLVRNQLWEGLRKAVQSPPEGPVAELPRTEQSISRSHRIFLFVAATIVAFLTFYNLTESGYVAMLTTGAMLVLAFFFTAVASYIVGFLGTSNSPISGMTICAVIATAFLLLVGGVTGSTGIIATLAVAGVVCCASASAGDLSQNLRTGHLVGATPKNQQWLKVLGVAIPAVLVAPVMLVLHHAYGIGTGRPGALKAPQATLFASLAKGLFNEGTLPWTFIFIGMGIGVVVILADQALKARGARFRMPVMAVAVGMYLPLTLSFPMLLGGVVAAFVKGEHAMENGVLFSSGLIAGEALAGVGIGAMLYWNRNLLPMGLKGNNVVSLIAIVGLAAILWVGASYSKKKA